MNNIKLLNIEKDRDYLRKQTDQIELDDINLKSIIRILKKYCFQNNIKAISANQLGISKQIIYFNKIIINPIVLEKKGLVSSVEKSISLGCLIPHLVRPYKIKIEYYNDLLEKKEEEYIGEDSITLIRHIDYLNGIFPTDSADIIFRVPSSKIDLFPHYFEYKELEREGDFEELKQKTLKRK